MNIKSILDNEKAEVLFSLVLSFCIHKGDFFNGWYFSFLANLLKKWI